MIPNTILITNGKGGVGKTSLATNLAGLAAHNAWRTLLIDIDPQGNAARDLGVIDDTDDGTNLADAILARTPLAPMRNIREGLDFAAGGPALDTVGADIHALMARGHYLTALGRLETAITPHTNRYDLIVIDSPPGEKALQTLAARAAHHIVIPTAPDDCSIDGLAAVCERLHHLRSEGGNPDLNILGIAITLVVTNATAVQRRVRSALADLLGDQVPAFANTIRFAQAAAAGARTTGRLAHEYQADAATAEPWWKTRTAGTVTPTFSSAAAGLADDYRRLADEILAAYVTHATGRRLHLVGASA